MKKYIIGMMAATAMALMGTTASADTINVCTGGKGGNYEATGLYLAAQLKGTHDVNVINTAGSWENLQKIASGECDAAPVQTDALYVWGKEGNFLDYVGVDQLFTEYVHLLCRRDLNVDQMYDLGKNAKIFAGEPGSGSNISIRGMIGADEEFGGKQYVGFALLNDGGRTALAKLNGGAADCMVATAAPGTKLLSGDAQRFGDNLVLINVEDKDFNDVTVTDANGKTVSVWNPAVLSYNSYNKIMPSGFLGRKDVNTFGVNASFIVSNKFVESNPDAFADVAFAIQDVKNVLKADRGLVLENN